MNYKQAFIFSGAFLLIVTVGVLGYLFSDNMRTVMESAALTIKSALLL